MQDMPRPRPPYLNRETTRHGRVVWYVRIGAGPRIRIHAAFGTPEFMAEYRAAVAGEPLPKAGKPASGTLRWLFDRYTASADWRALKPSTRKQRSNVLANVLDKAGSEQFRHITRQDIADGRDRRAATPFAAKHFVQAMKAMFAWAVEAGLAESNPADGVKVRRPKTAGFPIWEETDIAAYEARWPIGTRERLAFDILRYTGLRRGDAVRLGRQHVRNGVARIKTEKTGETAIFPIAPELAASIAATKTGDLAFIVGEGGKPLTKESFGNAFREWANAAGVKKSAHGLRKYDATDAATGGATEYELMARLGWSDARTAGIYTRQVNREKLAMRAAEKRARAASEENKKSTSIPAPVGTVRGATSNGE